MLKKRKSPLFDTSYNLICANCGNRKGMHEASTLRCPIRVGIFDHNKFDNISHFSLINKDQIKIKPLDEEDGAYD